jgi:hypothetical protein
MYSTGVGLVLKGFENKIKSNLNQINNDESEEDSTKEKPKSLIALFTDFFEDNID